MDMGVDTMPDQIVHKLIATTKTIDNLNNLVLCWYFHGAPTPDKIPHIKFAVGIEDVTCEECLAIWPHVGLPM